MNNSIVEQYPFYAFYGCLTLGNLESLFNAWDEKEKQLFDIVSMNYLDGRFYSLADAESVIRTAFYKLNAEDAFDLQCRIKKYVKIHPAEYVASNGYGMLE